MSQPRKAMKSLGFQGCCLRCDAEDIPGLKRCNNCIETHKKVKNILLSDADSQLVQHMRELYSMLSKPEMFDTDEVHGQELVFQQSLVSGVEFEEGFVYPEDIEELYVKQEESEQRRIMEDLVNKNPWKYKAPSNDSNTFASCLFAIFSWLHAQWVRGVVSAARCAPLSVELVRSRLSCRLSF